MAIFANEKVHDLLAKSFLKVKHMVGDAQDAANGACAEHSGVSTFGSRALPKAHRYALYMITALQKERGGNRAIYSPTHGDKYALLGHLEILRTFLRVLAEIVL